MSQVHAFRFLAAGCRASLRARFISSRMGQVPLLALAATLWAGTAQAQLSVSEAWVRATSAHQKVSAAYMQLRSAQAARIVAVKTPVTDHAELHEMKMAGDVMKMRQIAAIELPAGQPVSLQPGGLHVMLMDLKAPLKAGETVALTLVVETASGQRSELPVKAAIRAPGAAPAAASQPHGPGHGPAH